MIYLNCMYGGLGNNLLQINSALFLMQKYNIDYKELKIREKYEKRYDKKYNIRQNKDYIFENIKKHFIEDNFNFKNDLIDIEANYLCKLDNKKSYRLHTKIDYLNNLKNIYAYLDIKNKQKDILSKYKQFSEYVCIHIRRNDFLLYNKKSVLNDYDILNIVNIYRNNKILILSDDCNYIKKILKNDDIVYSDTLNVSIDIEFLIGSICKKIIPNKNSTFSNSMKIFNEYYYE